MSTLEAVPCRDCGVSPFEGYIVKDHVWAAAGLGYRDGYLCLPCLETRLGRRLTYHDFHPCVLLYREEWSPFLRDRMADLPVPPITAA